MNGLGKDVVLTTPLHEEKQAVNGCWQSGISCIQVQAPLMSYAMPGSQH